MARRRGQHRRQRPTASAGHGSRYAAHSQQACCGQGGSERVGQAGQLEQHARDVPPGARPHGDLAVHGDQRPPAVQLRLQSPARAQDLLARRAGEHGAEDRYGHPASLRCAGLGRWRSAEALRTRVVRLLGVRRTATGTAPTVEVSSGSVPTVSPHAVAFSKVQKRAEKRLCQRLQRLRCGSFE